MNRQGTIFKICLEAGAVVFNTLSMLSATSEITEGQQYALATKGYPYQLYFKAAIAHFL